jgi:signal transduction histidine kinase
MAGGMPAHVEFMPHGICYLWDPAMVWVQVGSNSVIGLSYVAISATLAYLVYRLRDQIPFKAMYLAFGAFIVLCGLTHFFDVYVIWRPDYWVDGSVRIATAVVSAATAILLPPLVPRAVMLARGVHAAQARGIQLETAVKDLGDMYRRARELDEMKSQFFANVSHELRTPLALVLSPVERLASAANLTPEQRRDLDVVLRNARTLLKHVDDLLETARLEAGKVAPAYQQADAAALVQESAAHFTGLADDRGIRYTVNAPPALPAQLDREKVQRVLLNLVSNAFKFTPSGGAIRVELTAGDGRLRLVVADSGPGIPPDQRPLVFERFRQLDGGTTRAVGGIGLGLAIAKDFVEICGGRIGVGEAPEGGAAFTVELPLSAPPGVEVQPAVERGAARAEQVRDALSDLRARVEAAPLVRQQGLPTVLVVEDNPDMSRLLCDILSADCRTEAAFDGAEGLKRAADLRPDLIVTDVMMPGMGGDELVRALRQRPELQEIPIIVLTAKADDDLRIQLLREGAQDYVTKPFSAEELRARAGNLITLKRARDVLREAKIAAEAANDELEAFSYSVSHDLRAPLRGLDGFSQVLLQEHAERLDDEGRDYLQRIRAAAQRMAALIDDLLRLSRLGRGSLNRQTVDLSAMARDVAASLRETNGHGERVVTFEIEPGLLDVGDARLLRVALENLLGNAWKFSARRPRARIGFFRAEVEGVPAYVVEDNGAGFNMDYAEKLFVPFQRLHPASQFEGTGIGLATVRRIIRRHGGQIWARGTPEEGAAFTFTLSTQAAEQRRSAS